MAMLADKRVPRLLEVLREKGSWTSDLLLKKRQTADFTSSTSQFLYLFLPLDCPDIHFEK